MEVLNEVLWHSDRHPSMNVLGNDVVFVRNQNIQARAGPDAWGRDKAQQLKVSFRLYRSIAQAGKTDDIAHTMDYRRIQKAIEKSDNAIYLSPMQYVTWLAMELKEVIDGSYAEIDMEAPKAILQSEGLILRYQYQRGTHGNKALAVKQMVIPCIIGIGAHERIQKQPVVVDFAVDADANFLEDKGVPAVFKGVFETFEKSTFLTLEAFVTAFAQHLISKCGFSQAAVKAHKPAVFGMAEGPGVQIFRTREFFEQQKQST